MDPEEQDQLDLEKAQQEQRARNAQQDRLVIQATPLPPQPKIADPAIEGGVRGALALTEEDNAENEVLINRLSTLAGQPKAALRALDPAELQRLAREQGVLFGTENAPTLRGKFTNPDFARSASDDVKALAEIEKQMLEARAKMAPATPKPDGNTALLYPRGVSMWTPALKNATDVKAVDLPNPTDVGRAAVAGVVGDTITAAGGVVQSAAELTDEFFRSPVSPALAYLTDGKVRGEIPKNSADVLPRVAAWAEGARQVGTDVGDFIAPEETGNFVLDAINSGARSFGQSAVWVAAAALTGQPELAVGGLSAVTYGQKYGEYRDAGIAPFQAALGAGAQAGLEAATEALPFHLLIGDITNKTPFGEMLLKQLFTENATEQVATFTQDMVDWGMLNPDKTVGEFLAERPSAALQTAIATTMATLLQTSVAAGVDKAAASLDRSRREEERDAKVADAGREALKNLVAAAAESKTRERDPEQFRDFVDKLAQEGNVRAAYFSPEAFTRVAQAMGQTPDDLAVTFGVEGQVQAALASGAKIEVPLSAFLEKMGGLENAQAILKEVSHSPFHLSETEEAAVPEEARQRILAEAERVAQAAAEDQTFSDGVEAIRVDIEKQLNAVGRFVGTPNRLYAQLASIFYGNIARQLGVTPAEALARRPLSISGERITGGPVESTPAYNHGEAIDEEGNLIRGRIGAVDEARGPGFAVLDKAPDTTTEDLAKQLGLTARQASVLRKAWKESRGVPNNKKRRPGHPGPAYKQDAFEPLNTIAADNLADLPEDEWNDVIRATKYAAYNLPQGVTDVSLPKGYVVVQSSQGNYAVSEKHLKERQKTGERFAKLDQGKRGYYVPSESTILLMAKADLSTFLHEIGHHFLEMRFELAKQLKNEAEAGRVLTPGEQELLDDVRAWFRHAGIKPGNPGEGNALPQDVPWGLYFFDNILIDPTEAELKEFQKTQALAGKGPVIKLFKTTAGRIIAFPGNEYSHAEARMLLEHNNKPSAQFKMRHATWDGQSFKFQSWYETTGVLDDDGGKFAQEAINSLKEVGKLTPAERAEWYAAEVEEESTPRFNGRPKIKLSLRSDPALQYPDINIDISPQYNRDGRAGVAVDLYFNGNVDRDRDTKATVEDLAKAHQVFARGIAALQAYAEKHRPDYIAFTPTSTRTESRSKLYDALLRRYPFGYEARITSEIDIVATGTQTTKGRARRFLLVRPDIASEVPLELSNAEIKDGEWFGEPSVEKRRVITEIVQSGRSVPQPETGDTGGSGSGATDAGQSYAQSHPRKAVQVSDDTIDRASKELNEKQFEAWKLAVAGYGNEDIAVSMGGEDGDVTPAQVATWLFEAKGHGYEAPKQKAGLTLSPQTLHVIAMSARGSSLSEIADAVYPDRSKDKAINLVKQIRFRRKNLIEQWKAQKEGKFAQGPVFYSALKRAVENAKQAKAKASEWKAILKKAEGVKAEEIEWTGLFDYLDAVASGGNPEPGRYQNFPTRPANPGAVTKEDLLRFLSGNGVKVEEVKLNGTFDRAQVDALVEEKIAEYAQTLIGSFEFVGSYYVEQAENEDGTPTESWSIKVDGVAFGDDTYDSEEAAQEAADELNADQEQEGIEDALRSNRRKFEREAEAEIEEKNSPQFGSFALPGGSDYTELLLTLPNIKGPGTHWDTPNVVAHARFKTRLGPNGERVLALEEIQSDWHQAGKEQGYKAPFDQAKLDEAQTKLDEVIAARAVAREQVRSTQEALVNLLASEPYVSILEQMDQPKDGVQPIVRTVDTIRDLAQRKPFQLTGTLLPNTVGAVRVHLRKTGQALNDAETAALNEADAALLAAENASSEAFLREREAGIARDMARNPAGVPDAPFKDTKAWASLVLKRMIRYAAANGFDQLAWIPGNVKNGDAVPDTKAKVVELRADGGFQYQDAEGDWIRHDSYSSAPSSDGMTLNNVLGKEVADQLRKVEPDENGDRQLPGDFTIHNQPGWEFYDIIVPSAANALGKKYGAQVTSARLPVPPENGGKFQVTVAATGEVVGSYATRAEATRQFPGAGHVITEEGLTFHTLPLTPALKDAALDGMPLFQPEQDGPPSGNPLTPEEKAFFARAMRELPPGSDELDVWDNMSFAERTPYHELWARQVEAYFFEGKAPTPQHQRMFDKFREWVKDVYKHLLNLNAPLTDEVRGIMDRMLAAKEDIANAHRGHALQPLFTTQPEKMTDQEWEDYLRTNEQATADAEKNLSQRSLRDTKWLSNARSREMRRLQNEAREQRKAMGAEVAKEVLAEPVNVARAFLSRGVNKDGSKVDDFIGVFNKDNQLVTGKPKLSISALEAMYPEGSGVDWRKLGYGKYGMLAAEGLHPDSLAGMFGYESGDAMVRELTTAEPARDKIEGVTTQRMLERYGDLTNEAAIAQAADEAVYSSMRGKVLAAEYAALSAALGERKLLNEAAKQAASTLVRRLNASKLNANKFLAAERTAGRAAEAAFRKNDLAGAAAAKKDQLLNFYIAKEVMAKQKEYDKAKLKFKQILDAKRDTVSKSRNFDLVQASRAILATYGMAKMKNKPMEYMAAVKRYDPTLYSNLEPTLLNAMTSQQQLKDLTVEEFFGLRDVVVQLWDLAREEKLVEINGQKVDLKDVTDALNLHMEALGADPNKPISYAPTPAQRTLRMLEGAAGALRRVESWARLMDKGVAGPFTKFIWRPVSQAATRYRQDQTKYILKFRELFRPIEANLSNARIAATELGYTFANKAELLHAILHTGNASNKRKLLMGYRWAQERPDGSLDTTRWDAFLARMAHEGTLTVQDYQFAQSVWDLLEETKPLAQEAHRRVFGRYFAEITADVVHTPFGDFKGGYVPAIYDDYHNTDVALKRGQEAVEGNDSNMFPSPSKGFTEARVEYNRPMQLDVRLLASHLDKVLKFAHMAAPVRDVLRILRSPGVERHLHDLHATAIEDILLPWLVRSARQTNEMPIGGKAGRAVTTFANGLRARANMGLMFANIVNVLQQPTGIMNAMAFKGVKKRYIAQAMARFLRDPAGVHAAVRSLSPLIETRSSHQAVAMRDTLDTIVTPTGKFEKVGAWFERHTYFAQTALQNQQDVVVWLGAYESAKARNESEYEAAQFADGVIRQTQGSATPEDISRFETGTGWQKILTSMYGYFNMWGNHLSTEFRETVRDQGLKKGKGRLLYVYFVGFAAPALLAQLIADAIRGDLPEPDDEEEALAEWLGWVFGTQAKTAAAMVPLVGASVVAGVNAFNEKPYDDRVLSSPAVSAVETLVRVPKDFADYIGGEGDLSRTAKDTLSLLTLMTGVPFQALARPLGYLADVAEGDTEPTDAVDMARGMVAGR